MEVHNVAIVLAEDGEFIYGAHDVDAQYAWDQINDHINDALNNDVPGANTWHAFKMVPLLIAKQVQIINEFKSKFKIIGYQRKTVEHGWVEVFAEDLEHYRAKGQAIRPVYAPAEYVEAPPKEVKNG